MHEGQSLCEWGILTHSAIDFKKYRVAILQSNQRITFFVLKMIPLKGCDGASKFAWEILNVQVEQIIEFLCFWIF